MVLLLPSPGAKMGSTIQRTRPGDAMTILPEQQRGARVGACTVLMNRQRDNVLNWPKKSPRLFFKMLDCII